MLKFTKLNARFVYAGQFKLENLLPGLNGQTIGSSLGTIDLSGVTTLTLPSGTTIGGSSVVALGAITSTASTALTVAATGPSNYGLQVDESATNAKTGIKITAAASGSGVAITALGTSLGEDLTIDALRSGATGRVKIGTVAKTDVVIGSSSGVADFTFAEITGGTGATATLVTTGALAGGPATAAQDGWMKVKIAGTAVWIPVWK